MSLRALFLACTLAGCAASHEGPPRRDPAPTEPAAAPWSALSSAQRDELSALEMPVLLPAELPAIERASALTGDGWYVVQIHADAHGVMVQGNARPHAIDPEALVPMPTDQSVRGQDARFEVNEGIRHVTWNEGGVDYSISIECVEPFEDVRCTELDYARSLAEHLVQVGGGLR